jgi:hypothetical protein
MQLRAAPSLQPHIGDAVNQSPQGRAYLFEFVPPVGKGKDRLSVRLARFESEQQAYQHGNGLLEKYPVQTIKIFRVGPNGESIPIGTVPAPATPAATPSNN